MQLNEFSFKSPDTDDNVLLMCQKMKYFLVGETYTEEKLHKMLHCPHFNAKDWSHCLFILRNRKFTTQLQFTTLHFML